MTSDDMPKNTTTPSLLRIENMLSGIVIILVGTLLLAGNLGMELPWHLPENWWALFIYLGSVPSAMRAVRRYREVGTIDAQVVRAALSALAPAMIATIFLLGLSLATWWPLFVILGGLFAMVPGRRCMHRSDW
ncbi:MAG: hypothetical protein JSR26_12985 [Proteobacteria bacterium]|nr:hypothetical protein [Pseudomonadota bacterium]